MARGELIQRQWNLLKTLQTRGEGIPLRDLATQFDVAERTIQRDFEILQELGFPIDFEEDEFGKRYWRMPHDFFKTGPLVIGLTEAISLHLAERIITPLAGTVFADGLENLLDKIRSLVPGKALEHFAELDDIVYVRRMGQTDYAARGEVIRTLADAARSEKQIQMTYRSLWRGESYTTRCDPYGMVYYDGDLFFVGRSHRADAVRVFKVTRIESATPTGDSFKRPEEFSLEEHFRHSFGITQLEGEPIEVQVKFTGPAAKLVEERVWHESQELSWLPTEGTLFDSAPNEPDTLLGTFKLTAMAEFKKWIRGFGDQAEVIQPDWLRAEMRSEISSTLHRYDS